MRSASASATRKVGIVRATGQAVVARLLDSGIALTAVARTRSLPAMAVILTIPRAAAVTVAIGVAIAWARVGRRLTLMLQTDGLPLAATWATGQRRIVRAADQPGLAGTLDSTAARAALGSAPSLVADVLRQAAPGTTRQSGVVRTANEPRITVTLHATVAATATTGTWRTRGDRGGRAERGATD